MILSYFLLNFTIKKNIFVVTCSKVKYYQTSSIGRADVLKSNSNINQDDVTKLFDFVTLSKSLVAITGAGISTSSGIPDYRGPEGSYSKGHKPMVHQDFMKYPLSRKRYWARSMFGWKRFLEAKPNDAHYALSNLESNGLLKCIITQNVDRLHQQSGSQNVYDLHGRNDRVRCMSCQSIYSRRIIQQSLVDLNPSFLLQHSHVMLTADAMRADGDMELNDADFNQMEIPCCMKCGGVLKPDVVFFGDNVPLDRVDAIHVQ
eukprot:gene16327-22243_t